MYIHIYDCIYTYGFIFHIWMHIRDVTMSRTTHGNSARWEVVHISKWRIILEVVSYSKSSLIRGGIPDLPYDHLTGLLLKIAHWVRWFTDFYPPKMMSFHSDVSLPEGKRFLTLYLRTSCDVCNDPLDAPEAFRTISQTSLDTCPVCCIARSVWSHV